MDLENLKNENFLVDYKDKVLKNVIVQDNDKKEEKKYPYNDPLIINENPRIG